MPNRWPFLSVLVALAMWPLAADAGAADWTVSKASGQVWVVSTSARPASLGTDTLLQPGDKVQTGPNGRVLLTRGEETILVSPNSVISLPSNNLPSSASTTILQQAGSIAVKAEKRYFKHFEVETPFLAAIVKGTEFVVTVKAHVADVQVTAGKVEVIDLKSGQFALVLPGQTARASDRGAGGLMLHGPGVLSPVQQGTPGRIRLLPVNLPRNGLRAPAGRVGQVVKVVATASSRSTELDVVRISAPIGDVSLDASRATRGLAKTDTGSPTSPQTTRRSDTASSTIWSSGDSTFKGNAYGLNNNASNNGSNGVGAGIVNGKGKAKAKGKNS